jgi:predicted alpha/beta superfamily hydrolase
MVRLPIIIYFLLAGCLPTFAQYKISGITLDTDNDHPLAFVNIGIKRKNIGTTSGADGSFTITIPMSNMNDTLTFSMVGYDELNLPVKIINESEHKTFRLQKRKVDLKSVTVSVAKLHEKTFGLKENKTGFHITDGSTNHDDIFEIGQVVKLSAAPSKITSLNLLIHENRTDSGTFRINFYGFDGSMPTKKIVEKNIVQVKAIREGWIKFDLSQYNIYLQGKIVVAIEFIPVKEQSGPITYEVKIGGPSKSFVRTSSHGEWSIPPHHYRMNITALVSEDQQRNGQDTEEDISSEPEKVLFSKHVQDSFSIYIYTPASFDSLKRDRVYPVIYLLDANIYFDHLVSELINSKNEAIVVGIGYKDIQKLDSLRTRDYLFPGIAPSADLPVSGGADKFLNFLTLELMPDILQKYPVDTQHQTLMGHSYGGYFVLYSLLQAIQKNEKYFSTYVAASPSLEYSNRYLLSEFEKPGNLASSALNLLLSYGGKEDREDGGTGLDGSDNFNKLLDILDNDEFKRIKIRSKVYKSSGHMQTAVPTFMEGLKMP